MGCCGDREKYGSSTAEQRWDFLTLSDFKSTSCWTSFTYGVVYFFLVISVAVYVVDIYTATNLLFFDRWSSQVKPAIPFEISKWIFASCIIISYILLAYRVWRAARAMKTGLVTASYLDPLAVRIQSVRPGKGRGWRRFLVFTALTKGRKGSEYVALFTYFSFEAWTRIVFAEGPRQVINALTLWSVLQAKLIPVGEHAPDDDHTAVAQFFINVQILANANTQQATILFGMLYVLIIWVFSALGLIVAFLMYITFLWHHIPSSDGSLSRFCRRKVEKRLNQIVRARVDKAIAREHIERAKKVATGGTGASVGMPTESIDYKRQPTVPVLGGDADTSSALSAVQHLRIDTKPSEVRTASPFGVRPASPFMERPASPRPSNLSSALARDPMVPDVLGGYQRPEPPSRNTTQSSLHSNMSYASNAPLIGGAAMMGHRPYNQRAPPSGPSRMESDRSMSSSRGPPRSLTGMSQSTARSESAGPSRMGPPARVNTAMSGISHYSRHPMSRDTSFTSSHLSQRGPLGPSAPTSRPTQEYEMQSPTPTNNRPSPPSGGGGGYIPFNPSSQMSSQQRNFTQPPGPVYDYFGESHVPSRAGTAPIASSAGVYDDSIYDAYGASQTTQRPTIPFRPATAGPGPSAGEG